MLKNNKFKLAFLGALSISFFSIATIKQPIKAEKEKNGLIKQLSNGQIDWKNKVIIVKGMGAAPEKGSSAQKRLKAKIAARSDAYRNLAEIVHGVKVTSETEVENFVTKNDIIKSKVSGIIRGARQIGREKFLSDGTVEIEMYLPMFGNGSLANALDLGNYVTNKLNKDDSYSYKISYTGDNLVPIPKREKTVISQMEGDQNDKFTGLIVDARYLGVEPAMNPFIIGGGRITYPGRKIKIDPEAIVKHGVTDYLEDLDEAKNNKTKIGNKPLIVEAKGATGNPTRTDILLDELTIDKVMSENDKGNFLEKLNVIIVIDL